jgi:hypothetical protein
MTEPEATTAAVPSWRDLVKIHPAAALFPMMSTDELDAFAKDIGPGGRLTEPIVYWTRSLEPPRGRAVSKRIEVFLLDGRNRLETLTRCLPKSDHDYEWPASDYIIAAGQQMPDWKTAILLFGQVDEYVISANLHRRHLTGAKKSDVIAEVLKARPEMSDRAIGKLVGADGKTIAAVRSDPDRKIPDVEGLVEEPLQNRVGGTSEPATTPHQPNRTPRRRPLPKRTPQLSTPSSSPAQQRDQAIVGFSTLLRPQLVDTLDDLSRLLRDRRGRIVALPREKRLRLAAAYLDVFRISADDLKSEA